MLYSILNIVEIPLTKGYSTVVDPVDIDLDDLEWHAVAGTNGRVYAGRGWPNRIHLHRIILERALGRLLRSGELPDHWDNNPLNNLRSNLRIATFSQNNLNGRLMSNNTSGFRGVHWSASDKAWIAKISVNKKRIRLGSFSSAEEAYEAYKAAAIKYYGEFARFD